MSTFWKHSWNCLGTSFTTLRLMIRQSWLTNHWVICLGCRSRILVVRMLLFQRLNLSSIASKIEVLGVLLFRFYWEQILGVRYSYSLRLTMMLFLVVWGLGLISWLLFILRLLPTWSLLMINTRFVLDRHKQSVFWCWWPCLGLPLQRSTSSRSI